MNPTSKTFLCDVISDEYISQIKYRITEEGNTVSVCKNIINSIFKFATFGEEQWHSTIHGTLV